MEALITNRRKVGVTINTDTSYGFPVRKWTLNVGDSSYYLGQDVKVASRLLGMAPPHIMSIVKEIDTTSGDRFSNRKLANLIMDAVTDYGFSSAKFNKLMTKKGAWALACD